MLENMKACLFDLDGTLIDSMWMWDQIDIEYLSRFGHDVPPNLHKYIEGMSFSETAIYFKEHFQIEDSLEKIKKDWNQMAKHNYEHKVTLKQGAMDFIKYLHKKNIKMGICTSNSRELVDIVVKRFQLGEYFTSIRTSCEVKRGKPYPDIYLQGASDLNILPEHCLVFEDVPNGLKAGNAAGMKTCGVYDESSKYLEEENKKLADYFIYHYNEIS